MSISKDYLLKYTLQERDYYNLNKWHYKKINIIIILIFLLFFIVNVLIDYKNISAGIFKYSVSNGLLSLILILISIFILNNMIKKRSRAVYRRNEQLRSAIELKINDEKITDITGSSNIESSWKDLHKVINAGNYFYIMTSREGCIILPKREIKDMELMELIRSKTVRH